MRLTVLGCCGSYAAPGGACSGYLVQGGGKNLWLDAGPGTLANLQRICDEHLEGRYRLEVVDLLERPQLARGDQIFALPTLVRKLPEPIRKLVGDLSDTERALVGLDLRPRVSSRS